MLIVISVITHWHWLVLPGIFTAGDFWYLPNEFFKEFLTPPIILDGINSLGTGVANPTSNILYIIAGFLTKIHLGFGAWERIVFLWPIALMAPIPIYLFLVRIFKYPTAAFVGSLVYIFTSYILARETMHLHIVIVYLLAPALLIAFEHMLKTQTKQSILPFITLFGICSVFEIRISYICSLILFAYGIYLIATQSIIFSWKLVRILLYAIIPITLLQSYWLLPFLFAHSSLGYVSITSRSLFQSFYQVSTASTLSDPFWTGGILTDFIPQAIPWWAYGIPLSALIWIFFKKEGQRNPQFWFWLAIACIGIFLVKESNSPLPHIYQWIFNNIPGFRLFRDSSKFTILTALSCVFLITGSIAIVRKKSLYAAYSFILITSAIVLVNTWPFITGSIASMTRSYIIPSQFTELQHVLEQDTVFGRSLWIPSDERFVFESQTHPRLSLAALTASDLSQGWFPFVQNPNAPLSLPTQPIFKSLLNMASIRYIGEPSDSTNDVYKWYPTSKATFKSYVQRIPGLQQINPPESSMPLWKNPDAKPLVYLADNVVAVHGPLQYFSGIDPSPTTAFLFESDASKKIVTNDEFIPFLPSTLSVQQGIVSSTQTLPDSDALQTSIRNDTQDSVASITVKTSDNTLTLVATTSHGEQILATAPNTKQDYIVQINGKNLAYKNDQSAEQLLGVARLKQVGNTILFYANIQSSSLIADPSFEEGTWGDAGDCNNSDDSNLDTNSISSSQASQATDGAHSLSLIAGNHIACVHASISSLPIQAFYIGSFDYQLIHGNPGSIKVIGDSDSKELISTQLENTPAWQHSEFSFRTDSNQSASLYLYQPGNGSRVTPAQGLFDNFHIQAYQLISSATVNMQAEQQPVITRPYTPSDTSIADAQVDGQNIIQLPTSIPVGDCDNEDNSPLEQNGIRVSTIDTGNGKIGFSIQAKKHIACVTLPIPSFDSTYDHLLSVTYKTIKGEPPHITLYPSEKDSDATVNLPETNNSWNTYTTIISSAGIHKNPQLIIYAPANPEIAESLFSSISLIRIPILPPTFIRTQHDPLQPLSTTVSSINPTLYTLQVADLGNTPRLLVLSDKFDNGWNIFVAPKDSKNPSFFERVFGKKPGIQISESSHIETNGFANGWIIDPQEIQSQLGTTQNIKLILQYYPQRIMDIGTLISAITFIVYIVITTLTVWRYLKYRRIYYGTKL